MNQFSAALNATAEAQKNLRELVYELAHFLPDQPPLHAFVHHNTLHVFEEHCFEEAVVKAAELFSTEPFLKEEQYNTYLGQQRIRDSDIRFQVASSCDPTAASIFLGGLNRYQYRCERLQKYIPIPTAETIRFLVEENSASKKFDAQVPLIRSQEILRQCADRYSGLNDKQLEEKILTEVWTNLVKAQQALRSAQPPEPSAKLVRPRDVLLRLTEEDTDEYVHSLLIRLCGAFLDQGVAYWPMPDRELGFLQCFRRLYQLPYAPPNTHLDGLVEIVRQHQTHDMSAVQTIEWALQELEIEQADRREFILQTLLALRGWAGMFHHLELRPDHAPVHEPHASLIDFLAVRLILDTVAARAVKNSQLISSVQMQSILQQRQACNPDSAAGTDGYHPLVYEAFITAQILPIYLPGLLEPASAKAWLCEVEAFGELERRKLLHLAYERAYRNQILDGLLSHGMKLRNQAVSEADPPYVQAVFCIDDREESLRRHLEELLPDAETFGFAGFFGAAIQYQGMDDVRSKPLCPVVVTPQHYIQEKANDPAEHERYRKARKRLGLLQHRGRVASKTMARGSLVSAFFGIFNLPTLVLRSISPSLYIALEHALHPHDKPSTRLDFERQQEAEGEGLKRGYSTREMTTIVENTLRTMNLQKQLSDLVIFIGHGSSSLNNPHEAAHDCGATGGGRGGPNARVFASMANHPMVRTMLKERGLIIADATWFVGAYHNTCDDTMTYYDVDLIPATHLKKFNNVKKTFEQACILDAHERCRRFETTPKDISPLRALEFAKVHANDLAEPRPEYGHATNSICFVGRRQRTKGLFLDRRAFLVSYDPTADEDGAILHNLLQSVGPVGAGINLEYYFSFVDPSGYGCGTKLPHNITGLIGVMDGHGTDLRTGLPWQMVEIHEPVRLLVIVEAKTETLEQILHQAPALARLIQNRWILLAALDPDSECCYEFTESGFRPYEVESWYLSSYEHSSDYYTGKQQHLSPAHIRASIASRQL